MLNWPTKKFKIIYIVISVAIIVSCSDSDTRSLQIDKMFASDEIMSNTMVMQENLCEIKLFAKKLNDDEWPIYLTWFMLLSFDDLEDLNITTNDSVIGWFETGYPSRPDLDDIWEGGNKMQGIWNSDEYKDCGDNKFGSHTMHLEYK
tara:strand:- start:480 stop:920 length:441 start_codon:yes stop_codon:yes gene_type:complete